MKVMKLKKKHCFEKFINRILKNGNKYKYFKYFKNVLILFRYMKFFFLKKQLKYMFLSPNIFEEEILFWNYSEYSVSYKIKKDFKTKKKNKELFGKIVKNSKEITELYKWLYLLSYKLPIRSFQLRIFYISCMVTLHGLFSHNLENESKSIFAKSSLYSSKKFFFKKKKFNFFNKRKLILSINLCFY